MKKAKQVKVPAEARNKQQLVIKAIRTGFVLFAFCGMSGTILGAEHLTSSAGWHKGSPAIVTSQDSANSQAKTKPHPDGVVMKSGKMMVIKNGQKTAMTSDMTMSDGTKVTTDGTVIKKDGTRIMMKEGEHMDMSGNMSQMKKPGTPAKKSNGKSGQNPTPYKDSIPRN